MAERDRIRDFLGGLQHLELHVEGFAFERENINIMYSSFCAISIKIPLKQKLRQYKAGALSVLTFGHTNWTLSAKLQSTFKGWNSRSRCMAVITNRDWGSHAQRGVGAPRPT